MGGTTDSARTTAGLLPLLVHPPGIFSRTPCPQPERHRSCFQAPAKDFFPCTVLAHRAT